jgi:hypothetical protein
MINIDVKLWLMPDFTFFEILEESTEVILANDRDIKNVPGRKTDVKGCEWMVQLLRRGLTKGSFIPPIRNLRDITRGNRLPTV